MSRDAFEVKYTICGLERTVLFAIVPLFKPGTIPADGKRAGYALMKLDDKGGNQVQLGVNPRDSESCLVAAPETWERRYCGYRDETNATVLNIAPVKVEWPTGEIVR